MTYKIVPFRQDEFTRDSESSDTPYRCVIYPVNSTMVAEAVERRHKNWTVKTKALKDLIVQIGNYNFHVHKLPMVSRSGYLNRLVFERSDDRSAKGGCQKIRLENLPGGISSFELVVKFCYGMKIDVTVSNIASLYSAASFLEMSEDFEQGNLISKTEAFLSFVLFSSWKGTIQILKGSESVSSWAKELKITNRCVDSIAWKVYSEPKVSLFEEFEGEGDEKTENWWIEDVSSLRIDHFIQVIQLIKRKGTKQELIGSCITLWTSNWLSRVTNGLENATPVHLSQELQRVTVESLIRLLPVEENSVSCNFLLRLVKLGIATEIKPELLNKIEARVASMLEQCRVQDLLVKNNVEEDVAYDVNVVILVVQGYVRLAKKNTVSRIHSIGRLVDGYLALIARDKYLSVKDFHSLAEALPENARFCDDNLYRAMDMYLKAHPFLGEEERSSVCRAMDYHKLSQEARQHVMKNDRLPVQITIQVMLLEQVSFTRSMTGFGSSYQRTQAQTIIRVGKGPEEKWMLQRKEINIMRKEVDVMKMQLNQLQMCKIKMQKQLGKCIK